MRTLYRTGTLCVLLGASSAWAQKPAALATADVEAIRTAAKAYEKKGQEKDWAAWAGFFTQDAIFMPPHTPPKNGRAEIEAWGRSFPPFRDLKIEPVEIDGRGDLAYVRGRWSFVVTIPNQPELPDSGSYIEIWRKQPDGSWKLFRDTFNSDRPMPAPPGPAK